MIESLESLEYIGPMEMFTKLSKVGEHNCHVNSLSTSQGYYQLLCQVDVSDLVTWVKENNWATVIGYRCRNMAHRQGGHCENNVLPI